MQQAVGIQLNNQLLGRVYMFKASDVFILVAVMVSFFISAYLWFNGQKDEGLFTATWVPSILCFGLYFKVLSLKGQQS